MIANGQKRSIKTSQRAIRQLHFKIDAAGVVTGPDQKQVSATDNGTGAATCVLNNAFASSDYVVQLTPETADVICKVTIDSASQFAVETFDATDGTTAKEAVVHVTVTGSDISDKY